MSNTTEAPIDLDFDPVEELSGDELVDQHRELLDALHDDYAPHIHDWHETAVSRQSEVWNEIRDRADTEEPECPDCDTRRWGQAPGDPATCAGCGREARPETEEAIHEAWEAMTDEVRGE